MILKRPSLSASTQLEERSMQSQGMINGVGDMICDILSKPFLES